MTKETFLRELGRRLDSLPDREVEQQLSYYEELLNDMMEDGIREEAAVAKLGSIEEIAKEILLDQPLQTLVKNKVRPKRGWTAAAITVAVLGAPLWLSLLLAFVATAGAIALAIFAIILSLMLVVAAFACVGILIVIRGICLIPVSGSYAVFSVGVGFLTVGVTCLIAVAGQYAAVGLYRGGGWLYRTVKGMLVTKEA